MKTKYLIAAVVLTMIGGVAVAGLTQPQPVDVDLDNMFAQGDQYTARTTTDDTQFIGCGSRTFDDGMGNSFVFGFCQAEDADGDTVTCFTQNPVLIEAMRSTSDFAFITFSWIDDGQDGAECIRVGHSTQSFYLPNFKTKDKN